MKPTSKSTKIEPTKIALRRETLAVLTRDRLTHIIGGSEGPILTAFHTCFTQGEGPGN